MYVEEQLFPHKPYIVNTWRLMYADRRQDIIVGTEYTKQIQNAFISFLVPCHVQWQGSTLQLHSESTPEYVSYSCLFYSMSKAIGFSMMKFVLPQIMFFNLKSFIILLFIILSRWNRTFYCIKLQRDNLFHYGPAFIISCVNWKPFSFQLRGLSIFLSISCAWRTEISSKYRTLLYTVPRILLYDVLISCL